MTSSGPKPKAPQLTHFLCLPLVTKTSRPKLAARLATFKEDVIQSREAGGFDLPQDAVRPVGTLHLTLGMMSFPQDEGLDKAVEMLKSLQPRQILAGLKKPVMPELTGEDTAVSNAEEPPQILITLKGLHCMQKPEKTSVLYAPPSDPGGILQTFAESIKRAFKDAGLLAPDNRPLLLHATVVNTIYVKGNRNSHRAKNRDWNVVKNAQAIIDRYEGYEWVEDMLLEKIAICKMGAKPMAQDGVVVDAAYEVEAEIDV